MKWFVSLLMVLAFFAAGCASPAPAQPPYVPAQPQVTAQIDATSYPTLQAPQVNDNQNIGGFTVSLQRAWRDGKQVYTDVCYTLPDPSDWTVWSAQFNYQDQSITQFGATLLSKQAATTGQPGQRCDELNFYIPPDADLSAASLTIQSLGVQPTQDQYCSLYMPKIQDALKTRGIAITLECTPDANGVQSMHIASKPADMTQETADQIVYSDEFFTVKGPWTFPVSLGQ